MDERKKSECMEGRIAFAPKQAEPGTPVADVCRKLGAAEQTFDRRKKSVWRDAADCITQGR